MSTSKLAVTTEQRASFSKTLDAHHLRLLRKPLQTLQINVGKLCNQVCHHCHVEAGPTRTEIMEKKTFDRLLELLRTAPNVGTVDLTGGAPELNPHFCQFVKAVRSLNREVIDRCNLTVFFEPGLEKIPEFLAEHKVRVVASLPCYSQKNVDLQRGKGVFEKSIDALRHLNSLGYAAPGSGLHLSLVYNPVGPHLPPDQKTLEKEYKVRLKSDFGIEFNELYTITNMVIKRFEQQLRWSGKLDQYRDLLRDAFTDEAAENIMCRELISVGWDGKLFDCDFNQMLELPLPSNTRTIWDIKSLAEFDSGAIAFGEHCFGCTAGAGSSCQGSTSQ